MMGSEGGDFAFIHCWFDITLHALASGGETARLQALWQ